MQEFSIMIRSFQDVQDFVALATVQPFRVFVDNNQCRVNAKSFMGMFSLDFSKPTKVLTDCTLEQSQQFRQAAARFTAD